MLTYKILKRRIVLYILIEFTKNLELKINNFLFHTLVDYKIKYTSKLKRKIYVREKYLPNMELRDEHSEGGWLNVEAFACICPLKLQILLLRLHSLLFHLIFHCFRLFDLEIGLRFTLAWLFEDHG